MEHSFDQVVSKLYQAAGTVKPDAFRRYALALIAEVIDFDGVLWGTGHLESESFHSVDVLGVDESYPVALAKTRDDNPIYTAYKRSPGKAIDMSDVFTDEEFYQSTLYQDFYAHFNIERILGCISSDETSGITTLICLYRFEKENTFSSRDRELLQRLTFHLVNAASTAYFMHLKMQSPPTPHGSLAICDNQGMFFQVQPEFIQLIRDYYPDNDAPRLPFPSQVGEGKLLNDRLCYLIEPLGDLFCVRLWESSPLDLLSAKELAVVQAVVQGLSFKEAARKLSVAPSTVSNHLYRIYRKLKISSRTELAELVNQVSS